VIIGQLDEKTPELFPLLFLNIFVSAQQFLSELNKTWSQPSTRHNRGQGR